MNLHSASTEGDPGASRLQQQKESPRTVIVTHSHQLNTVMETRTGPIPVRQSLIHLNIFPNRVGNPPSDAMPAAGVVVSRPQPRDDAGRYFSNCLPTHRLAPRKLSSLTSRKLAVERMHEVSKRGTNCVHS